MLKKSIRKMLSMGERKSKTFTLDKLPFEKTKEICIPVEVVDTNPKLITTKYGSYGEYKLDQYAVLTYIFTGGYFGDDSACITLVNIKSGIKAVLHLPKSFKLNIISGAKKQAILKDLTAVKMSNLKMFLDNAGATMGADPEIFVEVNDNILPAFEFLESKDKGTMKTKNVPYGAQKIYWDGFQAEFEVNPSGCLGWMTDSIQAGLWAALDYAKNKNKDAKLSTKTVMVIPDDQLQKASDEHVSLGCMPSLNIYGMKGKEVSNPRHLPIRSAGGHIHFGWTKKTDEEIKNIVKALDAILGVCCVALFQGYDNPARRQYYGLAGEYRLPPHGLEYRTLSNAWLFHPMIANLVLDLARKAASFGLQGLLSEWKATEKETITCINKCDVKKAQEIMDRNKNIILQLLECSYREKGADNYDHLYQVLYNGIGFAIANPEDIAGNWTLNGNWVTHCNGIGKNVSTYLSNIVKEKKKAA